MAVYLGNNKITFDGISEIYVGSNKVYSKSSGVSLEVYYNASSPVSMKVYINNTEVYDTGSNPPSASGYINVGSYPIGSSAKLDCYHNTTSSSVVSYWCPQFRMKVDDGAWSSYSFSTNRGTYEFILSGNTQVSGEIKEDHKNSYFSVSSAAGNLDYTCGARSNQGVRYWDAFYPGYSYLTGSWNNAVSSSYYSQRVFWRFTGTGTNTGYSPATKYYGIFCTFNGRYYGISCPYNTTSVMYRGNLLSGFWGDDFKGKTSVPTTYESWVMDSIWQYSYYSILRDNSSIKTVYLESGSYIVCPLSSITQTIPLYIYANNSTSSYTLEVDLTNVSSWTGTGKITVFPKNYNTSYKVIFYAPSGLNIKYELKGTAGGTAQIIRTNK